MKNTLLKVWGIVLTLAIISGLLMATVPVSAGDLSWTNVNSPVVTQQTNANVFAMAADGKTIYLYSGDNGTGNGNLYKSSDAGMTWVSTGIGVSLDAANGTFPTINKIVVNQTNANELLASDGAHVWRSSNAGQNWYDTTPSLNGVPITGINGIDDTINGNGGTAILVSATSGVYLYSTDTGTWLTTGSGAMNTGWAGQKAYGAAFSPNFANDNTVFTFSSDNVSNLYIRAFVVNGNGWNGDIADTAIAVPGTSNSAPAYIASPTYVDFAFPTTGFTAGSSSTGKVFVGYSNGTTGYVVRDNTKTQNTGKTLTSSTTDLQVGSVAPYSIAFTGAYNTGTLAVGLVNDPTVYSITGVGTATSNFSWNASAQPPYSLSSTPMTTVNFSPTSTLLYAGTAGTVKGGSALSTSTDYNSFTGIAFVSVSGFANVAMASGGKTGINAVTEIQKLQDNMGTTTGSTAGSDDMYLYFKSIDTSNTWKLIFTSAAINYTQVSSPAYATDSTIYMYAGWPAVQNKIVKSTDGGATWNTLNVVGSVAPSAFAPIDGSNYWIGSSAGIRASNSANTTYLDGANPLAIIALPGAMLVWETNGEWWYSTDSGVTFTATGSAAAFGFIPVFTFTFDGKNWTIFQQDSAFNIQSYTVGVSTGWTVYLSAANLPTKLNGTPEAAPSTVIDKMTSIAKGPSGVWYFGSTGNANGQLWRTTITDLSKATANDFEAVVGSTALGGNLIGSPSVVGAADSNGFNTVYLNIKLNTAPSPLSYFPKWVVFTDSVVKAPTIVSPADKSQQLNTVGNVTLVDFTWNAVNHATAYDVQVAYDAAFTNLAYFNKTLANPVTITGTTLSQISLQPAKTYYWRVRVAVASPMASAWSAGTSFTTAGTASISTGLDTVGSIFPDQGQVITSTTMTFTWGSVATADSYEFQLNKDGVKVDSKTGITSTFITETGLTPGGQYTWQVRAISGGVPGTWVYRAFSTSAAVSNPTGGTTGTGGNTTITVSQPPANITVTAPAATIPQPTYNITVTGGSTGTTGTPAWAWIVIAIGAVLVIAVIVLIVRTRRV
jgi:hypothetical protein